MFFRFDGRSMIRVSHSVGYFLSRGRKWLGECHTAEHYQFPGVLLPIVEHVDPFGKHCRAAILLISGESAEDGPCNEGAKG